MENAGYDLRSAPDDRHTPYRHSFFSWTLDQALQLMALHLQLGLESQLHSDRQLPVIYWYLEYVHDVRTQNRRVSYRLPLTKAQKKNLLKVHPSATLPFFVLCSSLCLPALPILSRSKVAKKLNGIRA